MDPSARVSEAQSALSGRVLLVDDEQRIVNFVRRGLEAEGLEVDTAGGGEEGLRLATSRAAVVALAARPSSAQHRGATAS